MNEYLFQNFVESIKWQSVLFVDYFFCIAKIITKFPNQFFFFMRKMFCWCIGDDFLQTKSNLRNAEDQINENQKKKERVLYKVNNARKNDNDDDDDADGTFKRICSLMLGLRSWSKLFGPRGFCDILWCFSSIGLGIFNSGS